MDPFIIFGLGNPGKEYAHTRHNVGFMAVDRLSTAWDIDISRLQFKSLVGKGEFSGQKIILVKPQMFMNNSGNAVRSFISFYKINPENLLVIFDELDLPFGSIRIRKNGGSSGHRGMGSIISKSGTNEFARLRIGIGRPPGRMEPMDYVLKKFLPAEQPDLDLVLDKVVQSIEVLLVDGIEKAMTRFNHSVLPDEQ